MTHVCTHGCVDIPCRYGTRWAGHQLVAQCQSDAIILSQCHLHSSIHFKVFCGISFHISWQRSVVTFRVIKLIPMPSSTCLCVEKADFADYSAESTAHCERKTSYVQPAVCAGVRLGLDHLFLPHNSRTSKICNMFIEFRERSSFFVL